jgi:hypothetical protein
MDADDNRQTNDWKRAFERRSAADFADAFAEDVVLEATVMFKPVVGRENVKLVMEAASKVYENLIFTDQAVDDVRQYIEWKALAFKGVELAGVTVITRNKTGAIAHIAIHHRPLQAVTQFSSLLSERLRGIIDASHFLQA